MAGADAMRRRIEAHPWPRGGVEVVRANRGYTLHSRRTGGQVARLRPTGKGEDVQVLWWRGEGDVPFDVEDGEAALPALSR
jgi:hypothetical protein